MSAKKRVGAALALGLFLNAGAAQADYSETFTTGKNWLERFSLRQKFISLVAPAMLLRKFKVQLRRPLAAYIPTIDRVLVENPYLENEDIANIFASTVYAYEPESRKTLEWMQMEFAWRNTPFTEGYSPRLLLRRDS